MRIASRRELARDPGARLAIDVRPSGAAPLDRVGPPPRYYDTPPYEGEPQPAYDAPAPVYYTPGPAYYGAPAYVVQPAIGIGIGIGYWGGQGGHRGH